MTETNVDRAVAVSEWHDAASWDAFVHERDSTYAHRWAWRDVFAEAYGHPSFSLAASDERGLVAVLPLTLIRSRVFGTKLVSMPFLDHGSVCGSDTSARAALVREAQTIARGEGATLELRDTSPEAYGMATSLGKATMVLDLAADEDVRWRALPSERRNRIRKGQRSGLSARSGSAELLDAFYGVFAANMRDLGSPVHRRAFFESAIARLGDDVRVLVVDHDGRAVGGCVMVFHRGVVSIPWVSSRREAFALCANQVLYWEAMRVAAARGCTTLDFGRSTVGTSTFESKRQWGAEMRQLYWHHDAGARSSAEDTSRLDRAARLWRHMPLGLANIAGPLIRGRIAN